MTEFWHSRQVPHLESRRSCRENTCYRPHTHDRFSIGLVDSGTTVFSGAAGDPIRLAAGDVILIPAGHVHACNPDEGHWEYQMIQADQDWIAALLPPPAAHLLAGIKVYRQPQIYRWFTAINNTLFTDAAPSGIESGFRTGLHECASVEPAHQLVTCSDQELLARLDPVLRRLRQDESNPPLAELAELAGMGRYQLIRAMKRLTGFAPLAWRQNERVTASRRMLREGRALAETAHALGFVDQSHFHRVFRAHVATSPGTYRG
ncbi:helix-turn-helix transcriptional regulator [Arthrobacter sp. Sa2BUA2]|uniref:Helix-turn-helix transcriptional regulator n=1 Tax=Arthrobacter pullicola TaxID=2762224 RepID=A0ABR8YLD6_9MICC|nr:helix-turn-helix domain-containing protein [Arthrobacter pullicola]MBD8045055.1 helix-turn-helix transcriptional regulator [Arthrobacter pullicola]